MTGKIMPLRERDTSTVQAAADSRQCLTAGRPRPLVATPGATIVKQPGPAYVALLSPQ